MTSPANSENMTVALTTSDDQCHLASANMSCEAMTALAAREAQNNSVLLQYNTVHPVCQRFMELADRVDEYKLQKPSTFVKNACFTKTPAFQQGPWDKQFASDFAWQNISFDAWTKAKGTK